MPETAPTHRPLDGLPMFTEANPADRTTRIPRTTTGLGGTPPPRFAAEDPRRPAPTPRTPRASPVPNADDIRDGTQVDWRLVRSLRTQAADLLTDSLAQRPDLDEAAQQQQARQMILDLLRTHSTEAALTGRATFEAGEQDLLAQAIYDSLYGLGRLQPLVDNPNVENISVTGYDIVHLLLADGQKQRVEPVADSDEELIADIQFLAARGDREFSRAEPNLDLTLPGGERLAATAWISPRPLVSIRRHPLRDIEMADLIANDTVDPLVASLLTAAVRTNKAIVVTGDRGAGKTTTLRALCSVLDPSEALCTLETEYELMLEQLPHRHHEVFPLQSRPGGGEHGANGRRAGEITVDDLLARVQRFPANRLLVGEVRGKEITAMFKAMQAGAGSMSTVHSYSAHSAIDRLVTMAMNDGHFPAEYAQRLVATHIDLIVHISTNVTTVPGHNGAPSGRHHRRHIADVIALELGEGNQIVATTTVFRPGPDGRAQPGTLPDWLDDLAAAGFDRDTFNARRTP